MLPLQPHRKYPCGNDKKKEKKAREEAIKKLPSVTKYFTLTRPSIEENQSVTQDEISAPSETSTDFLRDKNSTSTLDDSVSINDKVYSNDESDKTDEETVERDPALWPLRLCENSHERNKYLRNDCLYFQNKNSSFKTSKREYNNQNRYFSPNLFQKILQNGEKCERKWLMFSESAGSVFCYACKLFSTDYDNPFVKDGFSNWKKGNEYICCHENSKEHYNCMSQYLNFSSKSNRIDKSMVQTFANEVQYWHKVLARVLSVIRLLAERGLPFRGTTETIGSPNNGNFLGMIELLAEYDPFLQQHIKLYANKGSGNVSYLSKTTYDEFIELMAEKVLQHIINEIKNAKYWGLVLDSTPDISHVDQLSVVIRYYANNQVYERFIDFIPIKSHKGKSMSEDVLSLLETLSIELENCRAQTYDNARNMSGEYNGLQACICGKNQLVFYVPCTGHSLNLVGECCVQVCSIAVNFFGVLQQLYVFFSASTGRWDILVGEKSILKNLSKTRWSRRSDASRALKDNFEGIYKALEKIANDVYQKPVVRNEASALMTHIIKLENAFMTVFWDFVLNRFDATSQYLQKVEVDLISASKMLLSLVDFVQNLRDKFSDFEGKAKELSPLVSKEYSDTNKRKITKRLADGGVQACTLSGSDNFRINTYYVIIDNLVVELQKRCKAYTHITELFGFLLHLLVMDEDDLQIKANKLVEVYSNDLDNSFFLELKQFIPLLKLQERGFFSNRSKESDKAIDELLNPVKVLNWIVANDMISVFPNTYIAYRILVTIPIANCETERSFSTLKRIKNMFRSTMLNERLSSLARLNIEKELLRSLDFDDVIAEYAAKKARKKCF